MASNKESGLFLMAMQKDLESKFPNVGRFGVVGDTPPVLNAERELLDKVEKTIRQRPDVEAARKAGLEPTALCPWSFAGSLNEK